MTTYTVVDGYSMLQISCVEAETPGDAARLAHIEALRENKLPYDAEFWRYEVHRPSWIAPNFAQNGGPTTLHGNGVPNVDDCLFVYVGSFPLEHAFEPTADALVAIVRPVQTTQ